MTDNKFVFKTKPFDHQLTALEKSYMKKNFAYFMEMGCVDGETEFLSNKGWIKFKDFDINKMERPFLVAQIEQSELNPDFFDLTFVPPTAFIHKKVDKMVRFKGPKMEVLVTEDHDNVCRLTTVKLNKRGHKLIPTFDNMMKSKDLAGWIYYINEKAPSKGFKRYSGAAFMPCPAYGGGVVGYEMKPTALSKLNQWELRLLVAIIADGTFPNKTNDKCVFEFNKPRKQVRFEMLCKKAGIPYVKEQRKNIVTKRYSIIAPYRTKVFGPEFYTLARTQLSAIFDEVPYWDGFADRKISNSIRYYSSIKESADFVQFLACIHGHYASVRPDTYNFATHKRMPWVVSWSTEGNVLTNYKNITNPKQNRSWAIIKEFEVIPGEADAYCLRVPSGMLFLRRDNHTFITGNSGKTKVMIDNMAYLYQNKHITGAVILAPKGVYRNWAEKEIPTHLIDEIPRETLVWKAEASAKYKKELLDKIRNFDTSSGIQILVYNIESLVSEAGKKIMDAFFKKHGDAVMGIVDESTCIKNHKAKRTKAAIEVGQKCKVKRIATGSPITNSPLDLFGQCSFLDKRLLGCGSYYAFRAKYAVVQRMQTRTGTSYDKILAYQNLDHLSRIIEPFSFRITKKECLDLPEKIYTTRDVQLTPEQISTYNEMLSQEVSFFQGEEMSVDLALTKMLRLHQILCGCFTSDDGKQISLPNRRVDELIQTINETSGKIIIWANYVQNIRDIKEALEHEYGAETVVTYYGDTSTDDRSSAIQRFQDPSSPVRFFVSNPSVGGRGITLTEASTEIYFSNNFSLETRQQSEDRAHRIGQKNNVTYIDLVVRHSMDEKIIKALLSKRNIANEILKDDLEAWISL